MCVSPEPVPVTNTTNSRKVIVVTDKPQPARNVIVEEVVEEEVQQFRGKFSFTPTTSSYSAPTTQQLVPPTKVITLEREPTLELAMPEEEEEEGDVEYFEEAPAHHKKGQHKRRRVEVVRDDYNNDNDNNNDYAEEVFSAHNVNTGRRIVRVEPQKGGHHKQQQYYKHHKRGPGGRGQPPLRQY
jgi:hypothetical protein